jgi:signal transduction histidine kinase/ActR/RegA family two-component response regulator
MPFKDLPVGRKLTLIIMAATGWALFFAAVGVLLYDLTTLRPRTSADLSAQAEIIRVNSTAALEFHDSAAAAENLRTLASRPEIAATIYDSAGRVFATHPDGAPPLGGPFEARETFTRDELTIARPILAEGDSVGWLFIRSGIPPLWQRLPQYSLLVGVLMLTLGVLAWMLSRMLRRSISDPLRRLADTAHVIGRDRDYRIRAMKDSDDEIGEVTSAFNDMLATIEAREAALRDSTQRLRDAMQAAGMAQWRWDVSRDAISWGGEEARIFPEGVRPRDASLAAFLDVIEPDDREPVERALRSAARTDGSCEVDIRLAGAEERRWIVLRGRAERGNESGLEVFGLATDVTERRSLQQQLVESQKMEAIGRLAGGIAHDFNNLLTAILGYARFAKAGLPEGSQARDDVHQIELAGDRAAALTGQLLAYARRQIVAPRIADLNELVGRMQRMLRRLIGEDVTLDLACASRLWPTRIDAAQFEQVLLNLIVNARDAMPDGGRIVIGTRNERFDAATVRSRPEMAPGDYVVLTVGDSGVGIEPATLGRIFEPFFTTKEQGKGTGLGLAVCYGIVRQAGGHIWATSEPGRGSTFTVLLPRSEAEAESPSEPTAVSPARGQETVLVVEDEPAVRALASRTLGSLGYHVLEAATGGEALGIARRYEGAIDVLVSDVVMPEMNGPAVAEAVAAARPGVRIVFMSGYTEAAIDTENLGIPGAVLLPKPFDPDVLGRAVRAVLDTAPAIDSAPPI